MPSLFSLLPLLLCSLTHADVLPLDDSRPFLSSGGQPIQWPSGGAGYLLASTPVLRVNYRGVFTELPGVRLRPLGALGWAVTPCNVSALGLCTTVFGTLFPAAQPTVTDVAARLPADWQGLGCANAQGVAVSSVANYDPSACDVLDEGADFVFSRNLLYYTTTSMPLWIYWLLVGCSVVLVRGLSQNIQAKREGQPWPSQTLPLAASLASILLVAHEGGRLYVTEVSM